MQKVINLTVNVCIKVPGKCMFVHTKHIWEDPSLFTLYRISSPVHRFKSYNSFSVSLIFSTEFKKMMR
jgi:hypothetical protein